jgi:hypothetical protein
LENANTHSSGAVRRTQRSSHYSTQAAQHRPKHDTGQVALEALAVVEREYGVPCAKPCIAYLLAGNRSHGERHEEAWTIAMELGQGHGLTRPEIEAVLARWARKIGYREERRVQRSAAAPFQTRANGEPRWRGPGRVKPGPSRYGRVLGKTCEAVGCPCNCPARAHDLNDGSRESWGRFLDLGWREYLTSQRLGKAADTYFAIYQRERQIGWRGTEPMHVAHRQLAKLTGYERKTVGKHLRALALVGLIFYKPGRKGIGSEASLVARVMPIPAPPSAREQARPRHELEQHLRQEQDLRQEQEQPRMTPSTTRALTTRGDLTEKVPSRDLRASLSESLSERVARLRASRA